MSMENTNMENSRLSGAMRIFEALSGVDEALLAKCEDEATAPVKGKVLSWSKVRSAGKQLHRKDSTAGMHLRWNKNRVAGTLAAAACVAMVGITLWSGLPNLSSTESAKDCATAASTTTECAAESSVETAAFQSTVTTAEDAGATSGSTSALADNKTECAEDTEGAATSETYTTEGTAEQGIVGKSNSAKQSGGEDSVNVQLESVKLDSRMEITEAEARAAAVLGAYVPTRLPAGYTCESARAGRNPDTGLYESIILCWVNGMDSIEIFISQESLEEITVTDIGKPETYNVHLYEIPYAETVPEEYWEDFDNPVFAAEELTLELVEARMKVVADAGDTDTPRGNFSVLYEDGVLVRFSGRGSAEDIWEMFRSIE